MTGTVVVTEETGPDTAIAVDAIETAADAVETAADAVETAAENNEDSGGAVIDAVLVAEALTVEQRLTRVEERLEDFATREEVESVRQAAFRAEDTALDAVVRAETATDPGEVESMIEATEVTEDKDGNTVLDAPADVPPPGSGQHILFAPGSEVRSRIGNWFGGKK